MTYRGHIQNGQVALDEPAALPEGAKVKVELDLEPSTPSKAVAYRDKWKRFQPLEMPGGSLSEELIRDRR